MEACTHSENQDPLLIPPPGENCLPKNLSVLAFHWYQAIKKHCKKFSGEWNLPRVHRNSKRIPHHCLSFPSVQHVIIFSVNYTEENGLLLPGRLPGYRNSDMKLLPSSTSKKVIWKSYQNATNECDDVHAVAYTTFCHVWRTLLPSVILMQPMADLCWQCQLNSQTILRSANSPEVEKS